MSRLSKIVLLELSGALQRDFFTAKLSIFCINKHLLLSLGLILHSNCPPLKFAQFANFTGPCLCPQSLSPLWCFNVPATQARKDSRPAPAVNKKCVSCRAVQQLLSLCLLLKMFVYFRRDSLALKGHQWRPWNQSRRCPEAARRLLRSLAPSVLIILLEQSGDLTFILPAPRQSGPAMGVSVVLDWTCHTPS